MKFLIARLNHETNTFSPVATPVASFAPDYDDAAFQANKGMRTAMAAFIDAAQRLGAQCITPVSATANPSGTVDAEAYRVLTDRIDERRHRGAHTLVGLERRVVIVRRKRCQRRGDG